MEKNLTKQRTFWLNILLSLLIVVSCSTSVFAENISIYEERLNAGLSNTEPYSYVLIKKAHADPTNASKYINEAILHSPNLPAIYFEAAKANFSFSSEGIFKAIDYLVQGVKAYKRNFWWSVSISGLFLISLIASFIATLLVIIFIRFLIEIPLLAHDINEDKKKILIPIFMLPLSVLGPLFFIAAALSVLGLYFRKIDKSIVYLSIFLLFLSPFLLKITNAFLSSSSPELRAIVEVNENKDNKFAITALKGKNDSASLFSYGLALKREGYYENAISAYKSISASFMTPEVYVNLGNSYVGLNNLSAANEMYKKSLEIKPLVTAYYNLSQTSRETIDFAKGDEYFLEATKLDREAVSRFRAISSRNLNRFVIDETLPSSLFLDRLKNRDIESVRIFSYHSSMLTYVVALFIGIVFVILDSSIRRRAFRCNRCNTILCSKCSKELLWGQMCSKCYKSIVKLDQLDSRERVAKLLKVQELQQRKKTIIKGLSFILPGLANIYSGRIMVGCLFMWPFLFFLFVVLLNPLLSTGLSTFTHDWLIIPSIVLMCILYLVSGITVRRRLSRTWL